MMETLRRDAISLPCGTLYCGHIAYGEPETLLHAAAALTAQPGAIALLSCPRKDARMLIFARSADGALDMAQLLRESGAERLVMGFPRNMDGTEGPRAALYREFAALLEQTTGMKPVLWDERRTTIEAHQILNEGNYHGKKRKNTVDAVAASLILEGYLAYLRNHKE